ncbi:DUF6615 family protein [Rhizobium leguminosarum]|uniref:DUF6615 family protein n=1 Tax=Rhizobium leguminosarum TaxID=384 RepID=UPI003F9C6D8B
MGSNRLLVLLPQEKFTGGDIEIHILLPGNRWIGLIIQAKRVELIGATRFETRELGYRDGKQHAELIAFADRMYMLPCYLFYVPAKAVEKSPSRSGAMICSADQLGIYRTFSPNSASSCPA